MTKLSTAAALAATQIAQTTQPEASPKKGLINYTYYFARVDFKLNSQKLDLNSFALQLQKTKGEQLFDEFKAKKADFLILPNNEQRKKENALKATSERNIDTPTLDFMPAVQAKLLPRCLIILDYDNAQKYEAAKAKFKDFARAEKSQKGGHLWIDISELLSDPSAYLELQSALPFKLKNAKGEEFGESFWGELSGGQVFYTPRLKTQTRAYYSLDFDNLSPAPLDLLNELENCKGDFTTPRPQAQETPQETPKAPQQKAKAKKELKAAKTPQNDENEQRDENGYFAKFSRKWWDKNTALTPFISGLDKCESVGDADIFALKAIYSDGTRALPLENIQEGNRNATISALAAFLAYYGYFENFTSFENILVKIAGRLCNLSIDEVKNIAKGKIQFLLDKNEYETAKQKAKNGDLLSELNILDYFAATNEDSSHKNSRYLVCDFRDLNNARITRTSEEIAAKMIMKAGYVPQLKFSQSGTPHLREENLPSVFTRHTGDLLQVKPATRGKDYFLNPLALGRNELISEILAKENEGFYSDDYKADLREFFLKHPFYEILSQNLIPNPKMRGKFLGDLGHFLRTRENANAMLTIFDNGSTGKTRILELFLEWCEIGDDAFAKYLPSVTKTTQSTNADNQITTTATAQFFRFKTPTICDIIGDFTGGVTAVGMNVISDNGSSRITKADLIALYGGELKNRIKNTYGREHLKYQNTRYVELHAFYVLFSNTPIYYTATDNTRFYFASGRRVIDIRDNESISRHFCGVYTCLKDIHEAMFRDRLKLLEYVLLIAPFESEYLSAGGYYNLEIYNDTTRQSLADLLDTYYDDKENPHPTKFAAALSEWLMVNGKINLNRLQECYDSDRPCLSLFAHLLNKLVKNSPLNLPQPEGTDGILRESLETSQIINFFGIADKLPSIETRRLKTIFTRLFYCKDMVKDRTAKGVGEQFAKNFKGYEGEDNRISFDSYEYTAPKADGGAEVTPTPPPIETSEDIQVERENRAGAVDLYTDFVGEAHRL